MVDCKLKILKVGYGYKKFKDCLSSLEWECVSLKFKIWQILAIKLVVALGYNLNKIKIATYFKNLTIDLHVLYALNTHVKFCVNQKLFTI